MEYKGELQRKNPQGQLWKGGEIISLLVIRGVWVEISLRIIGRLLYEPDYQAPVNTEEIDNRIKEIRKITKRTLGSNKKIEFFRWIAERIALNGQNAVWVPHRKLRRTPSILRVRHGGLWRTTGCVPPQGTTF